jgi:hypothetical protein
VLVTFKTDKHIPGVTNMFILIAIFFWIKLLLNMPNFLTYLYLSLKNGLFLPTRFFYPHNYSVSLTLLSDEVR